MAAAFRSPTQQFQDLQNDCVSSGHGQPGGMREMHWHPNADEWQYYLRGQARMTVFNTEPKATTNDFRRATSEWCARASATTSRTPAAKFFSSELFRANRYEEVSLAEWFGHLPPELLMQHLNLTREDLKNFRGIVAASCRSDDRCRAEIKNWSSARFGRLGFSWFLHGGSPG